MNDTRFKWLVTAMSIVAVLITVMLVFRPLSCSITAHHELGEYVYLEQNRKMGCVIAHTDKDCGKSTKTLCYAGELYQTANYSNGHWTFRYRRNFNTPLAFCAKCVTSRQMDMISDSIHSRQERLDSEQIQQLIDELQEIKEQCIMRENELKAYNEKWQIN